MATTSNPDDGKGRYLDAAEVAKILGGNYTAKTVKRHYRQWGLTPPYRFGKGLRWLESDVYQWIKDQRDKD